MWENKQQDKNIQQERELVYKRDYKWKSTNTSI